MNLGHEQFMARISELHYSNAYAKSSGTSEFLEVALSPVDDPSDFVVGFYQANGLQGEAIPLVNPGVQVTFDEDSREMVYVISCDNFGVKLTDPDGGGSKNYEAFALVNAESGETLQFYDIGRGTQNMVVGKGVAAGEVSDNLPVPTDAKAAGDSIQCNVDDPENQVYKAVSQADTGVICFSKGTQIRTPTGEKLIEEVNIGDLVVTKDHGAQPIRWIGKTTVTAVGAFAPLVFDPWTIGDERRMVVSPQHRLLIEGPKCEVLFGTPMVLVAAKFLVNGISVRQCQGGLVTYYHVMFDRHELIWADGAVAESFLVSAQSLALMDSGTRAEFSRLFPEIAFNRQLAGNSARPVVAAFEAGLLNG